MNVRLSPAPSAELGSAQQQEMAKLLTGSSRGGPPGGTQRGMASGVGALSPMESERTAVLGVHHPTPSVRAEKQNSYPTPRGLRTVVPLAPSHP